MPIENSVMQEILKEYDAVRAKNHEILVKRRQEVAKKAPEYFDYHRQIISLCMKRAEHALYSDKPDSDPQYQADLNALRSSKKQALLKAGFSADYLEPVYTCPLCRDTGFLETDQCECLKKRIRRVLYSQSGLEAQLSEQNFSTLSYSYYTGDDLISFQNAVSACKELTAHFRTKKDNLLLYGTVGCGKSFLSCCIAKELLDAGYSVLYFSAIALFDVLHKNSLYNGLEDLYNYDLVIIDDLGAEMTNSFVTTAFFYLLNERTLRGRATVISTNLNLSDIRDRYSDRIASRIVQNFKLLKLSGPDIRILKRLSTGK